MIKVPFDNSPYASSKRYALTQTSDLFGNIWYTKNCNFDEDGYLKLAARVALIKSSEDDSNFGLVSDFGRIGEGQFLVDTLVNQYTTDLSTASISISPDSFSLVPTSVGTGSRGVWYNKNWHVSDDSKVWYRPASGVTWVDSGISLTSGQQNIHCLEVFRNRDTFCVGDGNVVRQYSNNYVTTQDLTLPTDYQVVNISYANNRLGIVTRLANSSEGENIDAFFFIWDGITAVANSGIPVGSDQVLDITAYKSSWVILTRNGQLLYFNGAGWTTLSTLPFYFLNKIWGSFSTTLCYGDILQVNGDLIYINIPTSLSPYGEYGERYIQNFPTGVWCYDPSVGLYHRYSPSFSPFYLITASAGGIDTSTSIITASSGTIPSTGSPIRLGGAITGLTKTTEYYVINLSSSTFQVALTKADALAGTFITLTTNISNTTYFYAIEVLDYGTSKAGQTTNSVGSIALLGAKNKIYENLIFSSVENHKTLGDQYNDLCLTIPFFENRGYFVTTKSTSQNLTDEYQKVFIKYKPLKSTDLIIVKTKTIDILGLPIGSDQTEVSVTGCVWLNDTSFTTDSDFSIPMNYMSNFSRELECEIINGAGAGQSEQITSITYNSGIYTVNLADSINGVDPADVSEVVIDNFQKLGTIDSSNLDNYAEFAVAEPSKWILVKVEMRGSDVKIEEAQIINDLQRQSS